ncbi:MAG: pantetheine-phosphate adenylyltransferase [Clostridia bacterium]|nr:pantetheine-phosphate adenylyltransferase [Clostridia bacterium]
MNIAVYPGSFDPCTNGHLDIIRRTSSLFDKVIVAVLCNSGKKPLFTAEERVDIIKKVTADIENVEVISFSGLLVDCIKENNAKTVIKGLRAVSDFEYEFQMALTNRRLDSEVETLFIPASTEYMFLSSSIVKEIASYDGDLKGLVPDELIPVIKSRFN